jgi:hypothetical protein
MPILAIGTPDTALILERRTGRDGSLPSLHQLVDVIGVKCLCPFPAEHSLHGQTHPCFPFEWFACF